MYDTAQINTTLHAFGCINRRLVGNVCVSSVFTGHFFLVKVYKYYKAD